MSARATRRQLFGASAAMLLIGSAAAGEGKARELDGELIDACAAALAIDQESNRLYDAAPEDAPETHPAWMAWHTHLQDIYWGMAGEGPSFHQLVARISELPARTPEGLAAKVAVARAALPQGREDLEPCEVLVWSVLDDMAGSVGA